MGSDKGGKWMGWVGYGLGEYESAKFRGLFIFVAAILLTRDECG